MMILAGPWHEAASPPSGPPPRVMIRGPGQEGPTTSRRTGGAHQRIRHEYAKAAAEGPNMLGDLDVEDFLAPHVDEESRIKRAADSVQAGWVRWDTAAGELTWSDEMSRMFGYPAVTTHVALDLLRNGVHPDDRERSGWRWSRAGADASRSTSPSGCCGPTAPSDMCSAWWSS
jgi:hypothetical protein